MVERQQQQVEQQQNSIHKSIGGANSAATTEALKGQVQPTKQQGWQRTHTDEAIVNAMNNYSGRFLLKKRYIYQIGCI